MDERGWRPSPEKAFSAREKEPFDPVAQERLVFGLTHLAKADELNQQIQEARGLGDEEKAKALQYEKIMWASTVRGQLGGILAVSPERARRFFSVAAEHDPNVRQALEQRRMLGDKPLPEVEYVDAVRTVPDADLEMALRAYADVARDRFQEATREIPTLREELVQSVIADEHGLARMSLTPEQVRSRLESINVYVVDSLVRPLNENVGEYRQEENKVFIDINLSTEEREHIFKHELIHALSGRTLRASRAIGATLHQRLGLMSIGNRVRFAWANEAVTEELTNHYARNQSTEIYANERALLYAIVDASVTRGQPVRLDVFERAYFEHYESERTSGVPAWKELNRKLDVAFADALVPGGPGFLRSLEDVVEVEGAVAAATVVETSDWSKLRNAAKRIKEKEKARVLGLSWGEWDDTPESKA